MGGLFEVLHKELAADSSKLHGRVSEDEDSDWSIFKNLVWIRAAKGRDLNEIRHICSYEGP